MHSMNNPLSLEQTGTINMHIITVSRQFGSGGRELGKRLSDLLGWDYYDKEIIETLADEHNMDPKQVRRVLSHHGWHDLQLTYGRENMQFSEYLKELRASVDEWTHTKIREEAPDRRAALRADQML